MRYSVVATYAPWDTEMDDRIRAIVSEHGGEQMGAETCIPTMERKLDFRCESKRIAENIVKQIRRIDTVKATAFKDDEPWPEVVKVSLLDMQVCVPADWTDEQVTDYANSASPTGIRSDWAIRKEGSEYLQGAPERCPCDDREGCVHISLDC